MAFTRNIGGVDRAVRLAVGFLLLALGAWQRWTGVTAGIWLMVLGALIVIGAALRFCILYVPFGIRTCAPAAEVDAGRGTGRAPAAR